MNESRLRSETPGDRKKRLHALGSVLRVWLTNWQSLYPNFVITERTIAVYLESLLDFTPEVLNAACAEATKYAKEVFPKPGHIREAYERKASSDRASFLGPPAIKWDAIAPAELEERRQAFFQKILKQGKSS